MVTNVPKLLHMAGAVSSGILSRELTDADLRDVRTRTWDARNKWFDIGMELDVQYADLTAIRQQYGDDPNICMTEMLARWLNRRGTTWADLMQALRRPAVGYESLADKLESTLRCKTLDRDEVMPAIEPAEATQQLTTVSNKLDLKLAENSVKGIEKWQELGLQLNINPEKLSDLFNSRQSGAECRNEMMEKHDDNASWEKLDRALVRMGENQLAEKISKEHALSIESLTLKQEQATFANNEDSTQPDNSDDTDHSEKERLGDDYTAEDKEAMNVTNQDEIKHCFALLIDRLRNALKVGGIEASNISQYLKDTEKVTLQSRLSNLEAIFDYLQSAQLWSYDNFGLVDGLNKRFLGASSQSIKQQILEYKGKFNGYLAMKKIIHSEHFVEADESGDIEELEPTKIAAKYGVRERHKLKVKLELGGRKLSEVSLLYIAELWESLQEEYELPSLTAQIDYIMEKCLEIVWLISPMDAEKIWGSTKSHLPFFQKHNITLIAIDGHIVYESPDPEEQERRSQQAILEKKTGDAQLEKGEYQLATKSYSKAMDLDPNNAILPASKAKALFQQQLYAEAEKCCSMSLVLDENNAKAYLMRAKARAKLGKLELAIQDFQSTLKLEPGNMEANMHSARLEGELRRRAKRAKEEGPAKQSPSCLSVPQQPIKKKCSLVSSEASNEPEVCELSRQSSQTTPELEVAQTLDEWEISLRTLLGEKVLVTNSLSSEVPVSIFEEEGAVVGLFFSAIWCPPSKEFTPKLVDWYKRFKNGPKGHLLDIVFISSDFDDDEFREYCREMPWYALDFKDRDKETNLASRFKVNAIPTLVFVDGKTGKLISKEGRSIVEDDPSGEQFPWKPKPFHEILTGAKFIDQDQKQTEWDQLKGKTIGLFFSADWCPPGQQITPTLVATYHKLKETRRDFEFIYVSSDRTEEEWKTSLASMPWVSFHYGDERPEAIRKSFRVDSIPTLMVLDERGSVITTEGLTYIFNDPDGETFPWYVNALTEYTAEDINDTAYLIWFVPRASTSRAKEVLEPLAKEYISKKARENMEVKLMFFIAGEENETSTSIREKARLPRGDPLLAIIDVPRNQLHVADRSELNEENAKKFVYDYLTRRLIGRRLR